MSILLLFSMFAQFLLHSIVSSIMKNMLKILMDINVIIKINVNLDSKYIVSDKFSRVYSIFCLIIQPITNIQITNTFD